MIDEVGMQGEELRKGRTTMWKPRHGSMSKITKLAYINTKKRDILLAIFMEDYAFLPQL